MAQVAQDGIAVQFQPRKNKRRRLSYPSLLILSSIEEGEKIAYRQIVDRVKKAAVKEFHENEIKIVFNNLHSRHYIESPGRVVSGFGSEKVFELTPLGNCECQRFLSPLLAIVGEQRL